jgi:hypothetical protein
MPSALSCFPTNCSARANGSSSITPTAITPTAAWSFHTHDVIRGLLAKSLEIAALTEHGFHDIGKGRRCRTHTPAPTGVCQYRHLRLHLRCEDRQTVGSTGSNAGRQSLLALGNIGKAGASNLANRHP